MANAPWYREGLAFECTGCGDCCSGAPGFVWVDDSEIAALAIEMEMSADEFERKFVRQVGFRRSLVEYPDGDCIFFDRVSRKCTVYRSRPTQCRTWPFWNRNLRSREDWDAACQVCPGSGTGRLYTLQEIDVRRTAKDV